MNENILPGMLVKHPFKKDWGVGQVQSMIKSKITVNFENIGKVVINSKEIYLEKINKFE